MSSKKTVMLSFGIQTLLVFYYLPWTECRSSMENYAEAIKSLDNNLRNYDARNLPRPNSGNGNITITTNMYIRAIPKFDEINSEYEMQLTLRQSWLDKRLAYDANGRNNVKKITLKHEEYGNKLWNPDTFVVNELRGNFHDVVTPNNYIRVYPDGKVQYSVRITTTIYCPMNFESYPASSHDCTLKIASYAWQDKDVRYVWKSKDPVSIANPLQITSPYYLSPNSIPPETKHADKTTSTGTYSILEVVLKFNRAYKWDVLTIYVPWVMVMVISWTSFWIDPTEANSVVRFMIVLLCLFGSSYNAALINERIPKAVYTKMIDFWTGICVTFHFFTFLHTVVVHYLTRFDRCPERNEHGKPTQSCKARCCSSKPWHECLDIAARLIYPILFVVFCIFYGLKFSKHIAANY